MKKPVTEVHTLRYGDADYFDLCVPTLEKWCKTHGYSLTVWDNSHGYDVPKFVEREMVKQFLDNGSDQMIYIDADVFIHPLAPKFPAFEGIALATDQWHVMHLPHFKAWVAENYPNQLIENWEYSNAGVWSLDINAARKLLVAMKNTPMIEFFQEQHWFNLCAAKAVSAGATLTRMPDNWNRFGKNLEPSWFWHLWGDKKLQDYEVLKTTGLLEEVPSPTHRFHVPAPEGTDTPKVFTLEFIQDAGLGNQMFEWAAGYSISRKLNLPFRWIWKPSNLRDFGLKEFGIGENPLKNFPKVMSRAGQGSRKLRDLAMQRVTDSAEQFPTVACPFQDEQCFIDHADEIRKIYMDALKPFPLPHPRGTLPVGMQVRRGDYAKHPRLNVTTPEYFTNAMRWMRGQVDNPHFIIVSDDPQWCHQAFGYLDDVTIMPPQTAFDGIRTLATCDAHIISNSTFGWWGAWLGEKGNPVVVPEFWHIGGKSYGEWNPVPERWHKAPIGGIAGGKRAVIDPLPIVLEKELPKHEKAIVYPWHADLERWHELRYSLRSVLQNFEDKDCPIYILGTSKPSWLIEGKRVRYIGAYTYREALMKGVQLANKVLWMNDDIIMCNPVLWAGCERTLYMKDVGEEFLRVAETQTNPWREGALKVLRALNGEGVKNLRVYSTHTPYVYEREKAVEVMRKYGTWEKFPMELAYFHYHAIDPVKITTERTETLPAKEALFLNYTDRTLTAALKKEIAECFSEAAPWELNVKFAI
jgi:hypothetical protein